ncbi:ATP-binding domain-containing protein [Pseudomonas chlororaphis]|nr:AAA family ATPase [Pseudomonas chlororaphis]
MSTTFWIKTDQLDDEQRMAVENIPETDSFLLKGPAGSGKTNILLLRAKWLTLKRQSNFKIIVFTSSLREFIDQGCMHYGIDPNSTTTQMTFFKSILQEYSVPYELSNNFEADRTLLAGKVMSLIDEKRISDGYCGTLFVDEAQDYTDTELLVFRGLTKRLVLASDSRQSIYKTTHTPELPEKLVKGKIVSLRYHYRSGLKLCKVADAILSDTAAFPRLQGECRYPEAYIPSSVTPVPCENFSLQITAIIDNLTPQLALYPNEKIGVLFPKREQAAEFEALLETSPIVQAIDRIWVDTLHGAKGWEFRAVHLGGCESLSRMGATQKRLIYTGVLRGKTSVHLYYSGRLPGYLDSAMAVLEPPRANPSFDELF